MPQEVGELTFSETTESKSGVLERRQQGATSDVVNIQEEVKKTTPSRL